MANSATIPGRFREVWNIDFEFRRPGDNSERPAPVCLVAREFYSRRELRFFQDELRQLHRPPFNIGEDSLIVAFAVSAEASCFYVLDWPMPANILDLYAEHLLLLNDGRKRKNNLLSALARHRLPAMAAEYKEAMRNLILRSDHWSGAQQQEILNYCAGDVDAGEQLLAAMVRKDLIPNWDQALWRGAYMWCCAHIEHHGIPVDAELYQRLLSRWGEIKRALIQKIDADYRVYVADSFNRRKFAEYLNAHRIPWPYLPSGQLQLDQDVFKSQAKAYPQLTALRELTLTLGQMRSTGLSIGEDSRNRFWLRPLLSRTGRNQPSTSANIFGSAAWLRGLVTPQPGYGIAIIDWTAQEVAIAAGRSGDERMCNAYSSSDVHMAVAIDAKLAPVGATKATYPTARERGKTVTLGTNYGMSPFGVSAALGIPLAEGRQIVEAHHDAYPVFWRWMGQVMDNAMCTSLMSAPMGWQLHIVGEPNPRAIQNWTMQATGGEMLRAAVVKLVRAGLTICATAHDAIVLLAPLEQLWEHVALARSIMERVSLSFTRGLLVRTESRILRPGQRLIEPRGTRVWDMVMGLLEVIDGSHESDASHGSHGSDAMVIMGSVYKEEKKEEAQVLDARA